ncbi:MAG: DUF1772 domain-containing protein [Pseudobdellovibrionaceae bacterium]
MKFTVILRYISLLIAGMMAGSSFSTLVGLSPGIERLSMPSCAELLKSMDLPFAQLTYIFYFALIFILCTNLFLIREKWKTLEFLLVLFSLACVSDDLITRTVGDFSINHGTSAFQNTVQAHWFEIRTQWFNFMCIRCALQISSFVLLLSSTYLMNQSRPSRKDVFAAVLGHVSQ